MNFTSALTSKGRITIPATVRSALGLRPGARVNFVKTDQGFVITPSTFFIRQLKGIVPKPFTPVSISDMNVASGEYF
ncbi:MAG: AbrB/MazE/SpoVT family DNA-binding domain-containing protein [Zoogloeaceae bacterium]|jgi:AbrB family looped-hinge helix DNA binding protein|nr:AbrB/MazE/SpoVT family DNA-binding domain-containing protein [Zoogloeaceae bacterium]